MNANDCLQEKRSSQVLGYLAVPFAVMLIVPLLLLFPVIGILAAVPTLAIAAAFALAPQSRACRLITKAFK